jgi:hypothetical protein
METPDDPSDAAVRGATASEGDASRQNEGVAAPTIAGLFGGTLVVEVERSFEPCGAEVLALLSNAPASEVQISSAVEIVRFHAASDRVEYGADLSGLAPLAEASLSVTDGLAIIARVASALATLHTAGESHGDLGPWSVRVGNGRVVLLTPPPGVAAGALIAARVRHAGAPLSDAAFCSERALAGRKGGPEDDVYALAGLTHWMISRELPVGRVDTSAAGHGHLRDLAYMVSGGLATSPGRRPPMTTCAWALWKTVQSGPQTSWAVAPIETGQPAAVGVPAASVPAASVPAASVPAASVPAASDVTASVATRTAVVAGQGAPIPQDVQPRVDEPPRSVTLTLLLVVGGLFVLVGAVWIAAAGWSILGEGGRALLLFALTGGLAAGGLSLEKKGYSSGFALVVLASQMLWADGGYVLNYFHALSSVGAWAAVAVFVTAVSTRLAVKRKSFRVGVLAAIGFTVFLACFNVATGRPGQFAFFSALTLTLLASSTFAVRKESVLTGTVLLVVGSLLFWLDAALFLDMIHLSSSGAWAAAAALIFAATLAVAWARKSPAVGYFAVFDFLMFVALFAQATSRPGQLGLMVTLTIAAAILGLRQEKRGQEFLGQALVLAATRLLWIDATLCLDMLHRSSSSGAWAAAAALIFTATLAVAWARKSLVARYFAAFDFLMFAPLFAYTTGRPGQLGLLVALTIAAAIVGLRQEKKGQEFVGQALILAATRLLWIDAALCLDMVGLVSSPGAWTLAAAVVFAITYATSLRGYPTVAFLAALDASVFASCLGTFLPRGEPLGPPVYSFCVAWFYAALSAGAHRAQRPGTSVMFAVFGLLAALTSVVLGVALMSDEGHRVFGSAWPYVAVASLAPFALRAAPAHCTIAQIGIAVLLGIVPVVEVLLRSNDPVYVVVAAVSGVVVIAATLRTPTPTLQLAGASIGALNAALIPSVAFLGKCLDRGGLDVLRSSSAPYMIAALGGPIALLWSAASSDPDTTPKNRYRRIEIVALLQLFGLTTLGSLIRSEDFFYPALILLTGAFSLWLGATRKHVVIVVIASGALLLNLCIQYFQKLRDTFPTAVLAVGFGVGLLIAGGIYERKLRHVLPKLKDWQ